jgi:hypothetical protein
MKLHKWRCGSCGFEWFEPADPGKSDHNIDHGCPQGCDDAGKVIDIVEATDNKGQWICWILNRDDIDIAANKAGVKSKALTEDNYKEIARTFTKGLEWANEEWTDILEDALKEVVR